MKQNSTPTLREAIATIVIVAALVIVCLPLQSGLQAVFLPLTLGVGVVGVLSFYLRKPWVEFQQGVIEGVSKVSATQVTGRRKRAPAQEAGALSSVLEPTI